MPRFAPWAELANVSHGCPGLPPGRNSQCGRIEDTFPRNEVALGIESLQLNAHLKIGRVGQGDAHISLGFQKGGEKPLDSAADLKGRGLCIHKGIRAHQEQEK